MNSGGIQCIYFFPKSIIPIMQNLNKLTEHAVYRNVRFGLRLK